MRSSDRIIHLGATRAETVGSAPTVVADLATRTSAAGSPAVFRGRRRGDAGPPNATGGLVGQVVGRVVTASERAMEGASAVLGVELQQALRIAEERGYAIGHARAVEELRSAVAAAAALAVKLEAMAPSRTNAVAHAIAEVSLSVARRVVGAQLIVDPTILVGALEAAVGKINGSPDARVLLHPDVVEQVRQTWEATHGRSYLGKSWTFEGDPALPPGGCVLRYEHGFVDAGLETQLEEIGIALDAAVPAIWSGTGRSSDQSIEQLAGASDPDNITDPGR